MTDYFVTVGTIMMGIGFFGWTIGWLLRGGVKWRVEPARSQRPTYRCTDHVHHSQKAADKCPALKTWLADYAAGRVDYEGNPIPQPDPAKPCAKCGRNHFGAECPPAGYRATDARTGEVMGYWTPRS